jgi:hypothetical protein
MREPCGFILGSIYGIFIQKVASLVLLRHVTLWEWDKGVYQDIEAGTHLCPVPTRAVNLAKPQKLLSQALPARSHIPSSARLQIPRRQC